MLDNWYGGPELKQETITLVSLQDDAGSKNKDLTWAMEFLTLKKQNSWFYLRSQWANDA